MSEMFPGVSSQPTMDTQRNQWSNQILMVNPSFPSLYPALPLMLSQSDENIWLSINLIFSITAPHFSNLSFSHCFSFFTYLAWFSMKYDMGGISENMIDFAACRIFHFLLDFPSLCELSYCVKAWGTIGHLKSELQHFQSHCSNKILTFFEKVKHYIWGLVLCDKGG